MTLAEAMAQQPAWVGYWLNWLMFGGFLLPFALLIWRETRFAGVLTVVAGALSVFGVTYLFNQYGYVKLLGLPHVLLWTPIAVVLWRTQRQELPKYARPVIWVILVTILISLAFDYTDVARYLLGERDPLVTATA